eukprot:TRINITY_DN5117_c0_g1_i1.p1 TRINITY_DN5117_c0_g1~~TRINITY_DN5117_c0_g1_i1.p1  ORF type:complete len:615 (+),score=132.72 TRINITY_DN5117_c0_g1_i1:419-2263(+)
MQDRPKRAVRKRKLSDVSEQVVKVVAPTRPRKKARSSHPPRAPIAGFVEKLLEMLHDPAAKKYIQWSPSGTSFICPRPDQLAQHVLGRFFKHHNFSSFVRQLNMYGWNKNMESTSFEFANPNFQRDHPELLPNIQRRKPASSASGSQSQATPAKSRNTANNSTSHNNTDSSGKQGKKGKKGKGASNGKRGARSSSSSRPASHAGQGRKNTAAYSRRVPTQLDLASIPAPAHLAQPSSHVETVPVAPEVQALFTSRAALTGGASDGDVGRSRRRSSQQSTGAPRRSRSRSRSRRSSSGPPLSEEDAKALMEQLQRERTALRAQIHEVQEARKDIARDHMKMATLNERLYKDLLASRRHQLMGIRKIQEVFVRVKALAANDNIPPPSLQPFTFPSREKLLSLRPGPRPRLTGEPKDMERVRGGASGQAGVDVPPSPSTIELTQQRMRAPGFMSPPVTRLFHSPYSEVRTGSSTPPRSTLASPLTDAELAQHRVGGSGGVFAQPSPLSALPSGPVAPKDAASEAVAAVATAVAAVAQQGSGATGPTTSSSSSRPGSAASNRLETPRLNAVRGEGESFEMMYGIPDYEPQPVQSLRGSTIFFQPQPSQHSAAAVETQS